MWNCGWTDQPATAELCQSASSPLLCSPGDFSIQYHQYKTPFLHPARSQLAAPSADPPAPPAASPAAPCPARRAPEASRSGEPSPPLRVGLFPSLLFLPWRRRLGDRRRHLSCLRPALCRRRAYPPGLFPSVNALESRFSILVCLRDQQTDKGI